MSITRDSQPGDHVHAVGRNSDNRLEPVTHFDYDEIDKNLDPFESDEQQQISFSDAAACWSLLLEWIVSGRNSSFTMAGARCHALMHFLDSDNCRFESLQAIANQAGCTRAALSKQLLELRDQLQMGFFFKKVGSRQANRDGQIRALEEGRHASQRHQRLKGMTAINSESNAPQQAHANGVGHPVESVSEKVLPEI